MITIRPGSRVHRLLFLLSVAGEYPVKSLHLLGNERGLKKLIHQLETVQDFRTDRDGTVYTTKLLNVSGKRDSRTIRLYKGALPILNELHSDALEYYLESYWGHRFPGDFTHVFRNHRLSEALALCMMAGIEIRPYILPRLQKTGIHHTVPEFPCFYVARDFKKLDISELNKTMFTRIVGALFYTGGLYAVYNTRSSVMKWSGMGEFKAAYHLQDLARMNVELDEVKSALLLGGSPEIALQTLIESDKSRRMEMRFDRIYPHIHFIPMDQDGIRLVRILTLPDWNDRVLGALFDSQMRPKGYGFMEYDAYWEGTYIYSHLDSDIARLVRFREALETQNETFEVMCFPWQAGFLKEYLGQRVILKQLEMESLEAALGIRSSATLEGEEKEA